MEKQFENLTNNYPEVKEIIDKEINHRNLLIDMDNSITRGYIKPKEHYVADSVYKRFLDVYKVAGSPKMKFVYSRPSYNMLTNTIKAFDFPGLVDELSHPISHKSFEQTWPWYIRAYSAFKDVGKKIAGEILGTLNHKDGYFHYDDPTTDEYRTHKLVKPVLDEYIFNGIKNPYVQK